MPNPQSAIRNPQSTKPLHVAILTAGGAGMFCGSCMHDNTWARALQEQGTEISLIPAYTPVRLDEPDISEHQVFFGGISVYLAYRSRLWRAVPRALTRWLDAPWIVNLATKFGVDNDAHHLGALTLAMLAGEEGPQRRQVDEFTEYLAHLGADVVCFSNALLVGALRRLRQRFTGRIYCILQGDDIFLEQLDEPYRTRAKQTIAERASEFDGFLVHSRYYRDFMSAYLGLPVEKFHQVPLGIDLDGHIGTPGPRNNRQFTVGYFARICPEKGLHRLIDAFEILHHKHPDTRLRAGGYLGKRDRSYFREIQQRTAKFGQAFEYIGSPATHAEKVDFLTSLDLLSVPTEYHEPKGLYVLEALANGVPVVEPRHGAFPELLEATQGGLLVEPGNAADLARALEELMLDVDRRTALSHAGYTNVRELYGPQTMAKKTLEILRSELTPGDASGSPPLGAEKQ